MTIYFKLTAILLLYACFSLEKTTAADGARPQPNPTLEKARSEFSKANYDQSLNSYRRYLRKNRSDHGAWTELAVTYYHTGLPDRALRLLKAHAGKTRVISYNYYYQGLSYLALGDDFRAQRYLTAAARYSDEYGSRSTFEMATIEYNAARDTQARYWLNLYRQRYPQGVFIRVVNKMLASLERGPKLTGITGNRKPNMEKALFKYNSKSLANRPHFWLVELGFENIAGIQADPDPEEKTGIKNEEFGSQDLLLNSSIGIGPISAKGATSWVGYNYNQRWITNKDRLDTYWEDPSDFSYFPFRPDLLERHHQIFGDVRGRIGRYFLVGTYAEQEFIRIGSEFFPGPEDDAEEGKVQNVARNSMLVPWIGVDYLENFQTILYFYLRKELNEEAPEFANKTYAFVGEDKPVMSLGLSHRMGFPKYKFDTTIELFRFEYIYNDNWLDFTRTGATAGAEYEFLPSIKLTALASYFEDTYTLLPLKQNSCSFVKDASADGQSSTPKRCPRTDTGSVYEIGVYWDYSQFERVAAKYTMMENRNSDQAVYDKSQNTIYVMATIAFPNVGKVKRLLDRFGEIAHRKVQE